MEKNNGDVKLQRKNNISEHFTWEEAMELGKMPSIWEWLRLFGEDCEDGDMGFLLDIEWIRPRILKMRGWEFINVDTPEAALVNKEKGISLPLAGLRNYSSGTLTNQSTSGYYWSSTKYKTHYAWCLHFNSGNGLVVTRSNESYGFSVRCVQN